MCFLYLIDLVRVRYKSDVLVSNSLGIFLLIIWVGPVFATLYTALITVFRLRRKTVSTLPWVVLVMFRFSIFFLMYYTGSLVLTRPYQFHHFLFFVLVAMGVNFVIYQIFYQLFVYGRITITKDGLIVLAYEILFPTILIPLNLAIINLLQRGDPLSYGLTYIFPVMLIFFYLTTRVHSHNWLMQEEQKKLTWYKDGLENVLLGSNLARSTEDAGSILQKWIQHLSKSLQYQVALVSLIDYDTGIVKRVASYGLSDEDFERLREVPIFMGDIKQFFDADYYLGGAYFIPAESSVVKEMKSHIFWKSAWEDEIKDRKAWNPDDLFIIPFSDSTNQMIGYISLDLPVSGRRPSLEEAEMANLFAEQIGRIVEASKEYGQMVEMSKKDLMTGLYNHTYFYGILEERIKTVSSKNPLSLIMLDIDNFKVLNDTYGHKKGDDVLIQVAKVIQQQLPADAICARYGGEEFAVLLFGLEKMKALQIGHRILSQIRKNRLGGVEVTLSAGVASAPEDGWDASAVVNASDTALYYSKRTGKDKITHA